MVDKQSKRGPGSGGKTSHNIRFTGDGKWLGSRPGWLCVDSHCFRLLLRF